MNLLAFDTACDSCSVALWRDGAVVAQHARAMVRGQSEALVPMIDSVMREAGATFGILSGVGVTIGPGAFTGLRIALATARAIGLAAQRPVIGVSTFEAIAMAVARGEIDESRTLVIAIDTKRDDLYVQSFSLDGSDIGFAALSPPVVLNAEDVSPTLPPGPLLLAGDGARRLAAVLNATARRATITMVTVPDAANVAAVAARRLATGAPLPPVRPLYLRPPAVRVPHLSSAGSPS